MKRRIFLLAFVASLGFGLHAQELVTLSAPVANPSKTTVRIQRITIDVVAKGVYIDVVDNNGVVSNAVYPTPAPADHPSQPTGQQLIQ